MMVHIWLYDRYIWLYEEFLQSIYEVVDLDLDLCLMCRFYVKW